MARARRVGRVIFSDILMVVCACMLLYPIAADIWNEGHASKLLGEYRASVAAMSDEDVGAIREAARVYNESLIGRGNSRFSMDDDEQETYESLLRVPSTDVMAYVTCEKIGVSDMPVYHGTSSEVLQVGVGHYAGSSLPVGGKGTHAVLSGHTGMAGLKMFSELSRLEMGDTFSIEVLGEVLTYEVDAIDRVYPEDMSDLEIDADEDYCTLVTCIPIGINSQRLLVRGHRVPTLDTNEAVGETGGINPLVAWWQRLTDRFATYELAMAAGAVAILGAFVISDMVRALRKRKKEARCLPQGRRHGCAA